MRSIAIVLFLGALPLAAACGPGKGAPGRSQHDITATAPAATTTAAATPAPAATSRTTSDSAPDIFPLFFQSALSQTDGAPDSALAGFGKGDPALEQYLLTQADLPAGYTVQGTFTARVPDGVSKTGGGDLAASTAMHGSPESGGADVLLSMVMRFDDLQDLESAFRDLNTSALQAQLGQLDGVPNGLFTDVHALDTSGLGDNAAGFSMTMDLGALLKAIAGSLGEAFGENGTPVALPTGVPDKLVMHMYFFGRGSYAGALMRISTGDSGDVDELGLAKIIDQRLASASASGT